MLASLRSPAPSCTWCPRRALLVALDLLRAAVAACLPFVSEVWHVYVLIFVLQSGSAAFTPTFQATMPDILPDEGDYTKALSLSRLAYDLEPSRARRSRPPCSA
jgi:MFS family permease